MNLFAERIKQLILEKGISQLELAERVGITPPRLNHYISGRYEAKLEIIKKIAIALNSSADYLLGRIDNNSAPGSSFALDKHNKGFMFDISGSYDRAIRTPVYGSSGAPKSEPISHMNIVSYAYPNYKGDYMLLLEDDSMAPVFNKGDLLGIKAVKLDPRSLDKSKNNYMVFKDSEDSIGRVVRKAEVDNDILIFTPANRDYSSTAYKMDGNRYDIIVGKVVVSLRSQGEYYGSWD